MMKATLLKRLLCLILIAFLPLTALAETAVPAQQKVITLSLTLGEELRSFPGVGDLFDSLAFQFHALKDANAFGLSLLLQDEEALSMNLRASKGGLYAQSAALYPESLYFAWEDLNAIIKDALKSSGLQGVAPESFSQSFSMAMISGMNASASTQQPMTLAESLLILQDPAYRQIVINATGGDDTYLVCVENILGRAAETKGEFTGDDHDPASLKWELSVTEADLIAMMDTTFMKQQLQAQMLPYAALLDESPDQRIDSVIAQSKEEIANLDIAMDLVVMYDDSPAMVYLSMPISILEKGEAEQPLGITMPIDYRRLTTDGNVSHSLNVIGKMVYDSNTETFSVKGQYDHFANGNRDLSLDVEANGNPQFAVKGIYEINGEERLGMLSLLPAGSDELLIRLARTITETGSENHLSIYMKDASHPMTLLDGDAPLLTLHALIDTLAPDGRFDAIHAATAESAIQLLKLEGDELAALIETIGSNALQAGMHCLTLLPSSALQMMPSP